MIKPNDSNESNDNRGVRPWVYFILALLIAIICLIWWFRDTPKKAEAMLDLGASPVIKIQKKKQFAVSPPASQIAETDTISETSFLEDGVIEVSGKVILVGSPPPETIIPMFNVRTRHFLVAPDGGLADVFVYVKSGLEGKIFPTPGNFSVRAGTNFFDQYVFGLQVGQSLIISNGMPHRFKAISSVGREGIWQELVVKFVGPDVFSKIICRVHPWVWGYAGIVTHPYFAVTGKDGSFKFPKGLPPGNYIIAAHHPKAGEVTQNLVAIRGGKYKLYFKIPVPSKIESDPIPSVPAEQSDELASDPSQTENNSNPTPGLQPVSGNIDGSGTVRGRVTLQGIPPPEKTIEMDATCGKLRENVRVTTRHYLVGPDKGLANVLVYIKEGFSERKFIAPKESVLFDQAGCMFQPYVLGAMTNQRIQFRNSDPVLHNVHATPKINEEFNLGQPMQGQVNEKSFAVPEVFVRLKCEVHGWMFAYVGVVENPYFSVTDKNGAFQFPPHLPPGKYTVAAVHQKAGELTQEIVISDVEPASVQFEFKAPAQ